MLRKTLILIAAMSIVAMAAVASQDDYNRMARISYLDGHVSFQHPNEVDWTAASINMALQPGDRIYTGEDGRAEIEIDDGSVLHLAEQSDIEILSLKEDFIQVRVLVGLCTLNLHSSISYEVGTPAAAFNTMRKGVYRFDVVENGDTDAIVRKGLLQAANNRFTSRVESGDLIHVTPGEAGTNAISRYDKRDTWDEWTDRRDADQVAYDSRKYLPDNVSMGVHELDSYGRWVVVDSYGPAWVPYSVDDSWSPYYEGRWWYRPIWGWTWVSYEPWGWLPYHYGRWYHHSSFGWCWLPGASFGFHFWSPGLVRFYQGPSWVSWCPLGPGDYYNVNNYYYNRSYNYYLNNLRMTQHHGPENLVNRNVPGAFRSVQTDSFVNRSFGGRGNNPVSSRVVQQPWREGRMVADRLSIEPTARSYAPAPDRPVARPSSSRSMPSVVRTEPAVEPSGGRNSVVRVNPGSAPSNSARENSGGSSSPGRAGGSIERPGSSSVDRMPNRPEAGNDRSGQSYRTPPPPVSAEPMRRNPGREAAAGASGRNDSGRSMPIAPPGSRSTTVNPPRNESPTPRSTQPRTDNTPPRRIESTPTPAPAPAPRNDRSAPSTERPRPQEKPKTQESYNYRSYSPPPARQYTSAPPRIEAAPAPQPRTWQQQPSFSVREVPRSSLGGNGSGGGSFSSPSFSAPSGGGRMASPGGAGRSSPQSPRSSSPGTSRPRGN